MGLYATVTAEVTCPRCGAASPGEWQFHFGGVGDLPIYRVGDLIRWDEIQRSNQCFGSPDMAAVVAIGYLADDMWCASCKHPHALVNVLIRAGRIEQVTFRSFEPWVPETLIVGPALS
ncbi:hypothetical protein [Hyalangium rubrum]|uniref:Ammonia monooxygenase n=1 Tax=Hyalangium rubrum TaxID=3103134 RepID=A0ABU5H805_9BACT|nr:hypothetical protein [Hyalangium sp. s54d21]MDY7229267.1 hypothetical protein [Hyalangium sp. s54d21]